MVVVAEDEGGGGVLVKSPNIVGEANKASILGLNVVPRRKLSHRIHARLLLTTHITEGGWVSTVQTPDWKYETLIATSSASTESAKQCLLPRQQIFDKKNSLSHLKLKPLIVIPPTIYE